jgi:hypothetical protein
MREVVWAAAAAAALAGPAAARDKMQVVQGTAGAGNDALEIHSGGLVVREGAAGAAFGTVRLGKGKRQLAYFLVFKHHLGGEGKTDFHEDALVEDAGGEGKQSLTIDGKTLRVHYHVKVGGAGKAAGEGLSLNKKAVDLARGRVFLVDLTVSPPTWEQRKLSLPAEAPLASSKKSAEELVGRVLPALVKQDRKVKAFVEGAAK